MSKDIELPKLNSFQSKKIIESLKKSKGVSKKEIMDKLSEDITEVLMLNGLSNGECSYVLLNVQRHILELEKNKKELTKLNLTTENINIDVLSIIMKTFANVYRESVDENGNPKR